MGWHDFIEIMSNVKTLTSRGWTFFANSSGITLYHTSYGKFTFNDYEQISNFLDKWLDD